MRHFVKELNVKQDCCNAIKADRIKHAANFASITVI